MAKRKIIITVAQTGAFQGKAANPNLPEQPDEIISSAYDCYNAGASIVHVHTRDKNGISTCDTNTFAEINGGIRAKCPIIIQNSTAPATVPGAVADDGLACFDLPKELLPDMCSLDCSLISTVWDKRTFIYEWTRDWIIRNAKRAKELGIRPELECFNPVSVSEVFKYLKPTGHFPEIPGITFVMGMDKVSQFGVPYSQKNVDIMLDMIPREEKAIFTVMAIGPSQLEGTIYSVIKGGHVRVGMEDNIYYRKGELATSNAQLVERMARIIREMDMEVATPEEARAILSMPQR